ncbi:MAG: glycosyltransferase family 39 protein [bacterium]|nr:glycosyltransferase family 39 protein [bacterium]
MTRREAAAVLGVLAAGAALRLVLWSGYGLGDDPGYWHSYHDIYASGIWNEDRAYDLRFAFSLPVAWTMRLLGDGEVGFIGFVTFCSLLNLLLAYGLARQEWGHRWALVAMAILATLPLDVLSSTLFVIDIPLATWCFGAFWLYRQACAAPPGGARVAWGVAAAVGLFLGYSTKQWAAIVGVLFALEALRDPRRTWPATAVCGGGFVALVGAYFGWQWLRFGDPLHDVTVVRRVAAFLPHDWHNQLDYARMLFLPNEYGTRFAGFVPHLAIALGVLVGWRRPGSWRWLAYFLLLFVALTSAPSHREKGQWVILVPHIFRYLCLLAIPMCLALAGGLRALASWSVSMAGAAVAVSLVLGVWQSIGLTAPTRDAYAEGRAAVALLAQHPDDTVHLDYDLAWRWIAMGLRRPGSARVRILRGETPGARAAEYRAIADGILVTGGARLPWYGCHRCTANLDEYPIPGTWRLLEERAGAPALYRREPLRVWRVDTVGPRAEDLLSSQRDWQMRARTLATLLAANEVELAAVMGERMLVVRPPAWLPGVRADVARACLRVDRPHCARRAFEDRPALILDRDALVLLVEATQRTAAFDEARALVTLLQRRFPDVPLEPAMTEIATGVAAGIAQYQVGRLCDARATLEDVWSDPEVPDALRRRAAHHLGLTLYRQRDLAAADTLADAYAATWGRDDVWMELRYRRGEAVARSDPAASRAAFEAIVAEAPESVWAGLARQQLGR